MEYNRRNILPTMALSFACLVLIGLPVDAAASEPIPSLIGLWSPAYLTALTYGLFFVVLVLFESAIITWVSGYRFPKVLWVIAPANLISGLISLLVGLAPGVLILLIASPPILLTAIRYGLKLRSIWPAIGLSLIPVTVVYGWVALTMEGGVSEATSTMYLSLIPAFIFTLAVEGTFAFQFLNMRGIWERLALANALSFVLVAVTLFAFSVEGEDNPLITPEYYGTQAVVAVESGKPDLAVAMAKKHYDLTKYIRSDQKLTGAQVSNALLRSNHKAEAIEIYRLVRAADPEDFVWGDQLEELEIRLAEELQIDDDPTSGTPSLRLSD